jgi:hypothetical protein
MNSKTKIRAGLEQADPPKIHRPRDRKCLHNSPAVEIAVVLAAIDFRPGSLVVRALDRPALQMTLSPAVRSDRVVYWLDLESLEVKANLNDIENWMEIDRHENNSDLNGPFPVKMFAVSQTGSFRKIQLRQTDPNHDGDSSLELTAFEVFGAVAGLQ